MGPNNRNMKESPRKKCPLPSMFFAREPPASSPHTSTTADMGDSRRSQTTVTSGNCSGTFSTAKALLTTTSSTGTCSSLEEAAVPKRRRSRDTLENEGEPNLVIHELFPSLSKNFQAILFFFFQLLVTILQQ